MMYRIMILFTLFLSCALGETLQLKNRLISPQSILYFEDSTNSLSFEDIQTKPFKKKENIFHFGYTNSTIWLKLSYRIEKDNISNYVLVIEKPYIDCVDMFYRQNHQLFTKRNGRMFSLSDKENPAEDIIFTIPNQKENTLYLRLKSTDLILLNLKIYPKEAYQKHLVNYSIFIGIYFGFLFSMIMYNLLLYIKIQDKNYFWYTIFLICILLTTSTNFNYFQAYIYRGNAWFNHYIPVLSYLMAVITALKMTQHFIETQKYVPIIHRILTLYLYIGILVIGLTMYIDKPTILIPITYSIFPLIIIYLSTVYMLKKKIRLARYFFVAFTLFMLGSGTIPLVFYGIIPNTFFTLHGYMFGTMAEVILISLALSYKINLITEEKNIVQQKLLQNTHQINIELEKKIDARTKNIQQINKQLASLLKDKELLLNEVYHRIKNNFQLLISILWIESRKKENKPYTDAFVIIMNRMKSMSILHDYLYDAQNLSSIDVNEYIPKIIQEIEAIYKKEHIQIDSTIDTCFLNQDESMSLGIIINEVLNNAIKHYTKDGTCKIQLSLLYDKENETFDLKIQDNGEGIDLEKLDHIESLGLNLIDQFSKKLKQATFEYQVQNGTLFILHFEKY